MQTSISPFRRWAGRIAAIVAAVTLVACSVEVDQGGGGYRPRPQPVCTMEYAPVCGQRGNDRQTFANTCEARTSGFRVVSRGECRHGRPEPDRGLACTREYAPVCGQRGNSRQTFANACEARSSGYDIIGRGECSRERPDRDRDDRNRDRDRNDRDRDRGDRDRADRGDRDRPRNERVCTMEYAPVCGQRGDNRQTFGNSCEADRAGFRVIHNGSCGPR